MSREKKISVAMAVYNGMHYIDEQIESILLQLDLEDELIISCDPSSDGTFEHIITLSEKDGRIHAFRGLGEGVIKNFENALYNCNNDYIFLCDQDDVWLPNKVQNVLNAFEKSGAGLILHDAKIVNAELEVMEPSFFFMRGCRTGILHNVIKNSYIGCCMAFKKELLDMVLPFPKKIPMHDQWIGIVAEKCSSVFLLRNSLILYRRHDKNASNITHSTLRCMAIWRINLVRELLKKGSQDENKS